jgi:hypothetical protein
MTVFLPKFHESAAVRRYVVVPLTVVVTPLAMIVTIMGVVVVTGNGQ